MGSGCPGMRIIGILDWAFFPVKRRTMPQIWLIGVEEESFERKNCHEARFAERIILLAFARSRFLIIRYCSVRCLRYVRNACFLLATDRFTSSDHHGTACVRVHCLVNGIVCLAADII